MKTASYLIKSRNGVYYARFVVPAALRGDAMGLAREVRISTLTKDPRAGVACARALRVAWDGLMRCGRVFSRTEIIHHLSVCINTFRRPPKDVMSYDIERPDGTVYRDIKPGEEAAVEEMIRRAEGIRGSTPLSTVALRPAAPSVDETDDLFPNLIPSKARKPLADWVQLYLDDVQERENRGQLIPKSREQQESKLDVFLGYCGNIKIGTIGAPLMKRYQSDLANYPPNRAKRGLLPGASVKYAMECVKAGTLFDKKGERVTGLSALTIDTYMTVARQFLAFAADEGAAYAPASKPRQAPAKKVTDAGESTGRLPFDRADMKALFEHPFMRERQYEYPAQYWVPHIAVFTGMRLNEICQLLVADVFQERGGMWMLNLAADTSLPGVGENTAAKLQKRLKTKASRRQIPIHSKLIELGLLAYVEARKASGSDVLFALSMDARDGMGQAVGRWFARYLRGKVGIKDSRKVFHSFRHTVVTEVAQTIVDASVQKGLPETKDNYPESLVLRSIVGHSNEHAFTAEASRKDVHTKVYQHGSNPQSKQRVMERLQYGVSFMPYAEPVPQPEKAAAAAAQPKKSVVRRLAKAKAVKPVAPFVLSIIK